MSCWRSASATRYHQEEWEPPAWSVQSCAANLFWLAVPRALPTPYSHYLAEKGCKVQIHWMPRCSTLSAAIADYTAGLWRQETTIYSQEDWPPEQRDGIMKKLHQEVSNAVHRSFSEPPDDPEGERPAKRQKTGASDGALNFSIESDGKIAFDAPQGFRVRLNIIEIGNGCIDRIHLHAATDEPLEQNLMNVMAKCASNPSTSQLAKFALKEHAFTFTTSIKSPNGTFKRSPEPDQFITRGINLQLRETVHPEPKSSFENSKPKITSESQNIISASQRVMT
ncbi:hypothetical protein B0H65DRAFT_567180 [Neurospora tetraspora]|uniref:Uncharacterized protein n=1 Tax=Neurospora tetraspora TaxID=94610 RepID=A0AAE0MU40_9PEZI|nr:hypothetical protein B0H65DRAFT_567180 [Neurospora tetraspora]